MSLIDDPVEPPAEARTRRRMLLEALGVSVVVTGAVTAASASLPDKYVATVVGFLFLGATWLFVWRRDDRVVENAGLALGGVVLPGKIDVARLGTSIAGALGWATLCAAITFGPFVWGWLRWWHPPNDFVLQMRPADFVNDVFGQLVIIALPEEAFYRGYLQSRLDEVFPQRLRVLGASVGPALVVTSLIFALGHVATIRAPARLAVFFPSLLFGWLRYRTRGIGAGLTFHAMCNVFSEILGQGFRVY